MMKNALDVGIRDASVGQSKEHPEICLRCEENIGEIGESRSFV